MFTALTAFARRNVLTASAAAGIGLAALAGFGMLPTSNAKDPAAVPTAREFVGPAAVVPLAQEPPAKLVVDPPLPGELAKGVAIVQFRTENARILPVYGPAAVTVSPRVGHLHVTVDDNPWHWAHSSGEPVIVAPLPPGPHKILLELADANHKVLASETVKFDVPRVSTTAVRAAEQGKTNADQAFLTKVIPGTAASVKVIEYAAKNATDEKVRDFAERVAKQHQEFVKTASGHAKRLNIAVVSDPDKDSKATIDKLSELKGTDLDVAFLQWLSAGHENTAVFDDEVKNGTDTDLKTFAKDAITSGHDHLHEARELLVRVEK